MPAPCAMADFVSYAESLPPLLDRIGAREAFVGQQRILLKPNLVNRSPFPVTLPVAAMAVLVDYVQSCSKAELVIGEGCGEAQVGSIEVLRHHGYEKLAMEKGIELVDFNEAETVRLTRPDCQVFPEFHLPRIALESFIVSFPVLKAHSLAEVTLAMKNMMGFPSHHHYRQGGRLAQVSLPPTHAPLDLRAQPLPQTRLVDHRRQCRSGRISPRRPNLSAAGEKAGAGFDPVAVDACGAALLGFDWREVEHIRLADGVLGRAEPT